MYSFRLYIHKENFILTLLANLLQISFPRVLPVRQTTWTVLQPLVNMLVIWGVFQLGFKTANLSGDIPFIVWYMPAFLVWNYFQEAFSQSANSVIEYSYLVKKVNFSVEIIPMIKIVSSAIIHVFFIAFILVVDMCLDACLIYIICSVFTILSVFLLRLLENVRSHSTQQNCQTPEINHSAQVFVEWYVIHETIAITSANIVHRIQSHKKHRRIR